MSGAETASAAPRRHAARPRAAATLILVDRAGGANRVLMGRRAAGHKFMPGKWVFPGGRIERQDFTAPLASTLRPDVEAAMDGLDARRAQALAVAAVRETYEETGLLLAAPADTARAPASWRGFCAGGVAPDLSALTLVARMVTPPQLPKRFDTRFFIAEADRLVDRTPVDSRELEELRWFGLDEMGDLTLASPTRVVLAELGMRLAGEERPVYVRWYKQPEP